MSQKIRYKTKKILNFHLNNTIPLFTAMIVLVQLIFPQFSVAAQELAVIDDLNTGNITQVIDYQNWDYSIRLPEIDYREPKWTVNITVTAYNSLPEQTDDTPCITASGLDVCDRNLEDVIATNLWYLPFGTKVRFPDLFGDKIFSIEDRMNKRYYQRADVWMQDYQTSRAFGKQYTRMEIF
jgi:3D (Asp-Asp-Asp) domain-containing protein